MNIAINQLQERVYIEDSNDKEMYFCPLCGCKVIRRLGDINAHCFAHPKHRSCDPWDNDMSEWHNRWQMLFAPCYLENVIERHEERHIADIKVDDVVIEVQHSSIPFKVLSERTRFYLSCVKKLIWIFDCTYTRARYQCENPESGKVTKVSVDYVKRTLQHLEYIKGTTIILQIETNAFLMLMPSKYGKGFDYDRWFSAVFLNWNDVMNYICAEINKSNHLRRNTFELLNPYVSMLEDLRDRKKKHRKENVLNKKNPASEADYVSHLIKSQEQKIRNERNWASWLEPSAEEIHKMAVDKAYLLIDQRNERREHDRRELEERYHQLRMHHVEILQYIKENRIE